MSRILYKIYFLVFFLIFSNIYSQVDTSSNSTLNENLDLKQLMDQKSTAEFSEMEKSIHQDIKVASSKTLSYRKSPSIISVITEEEIKNSGARDLLDVLRQVPGFDFGVDIQGVVGLGVRGNWSHEGKHLLLIDGLEMNEVMFGTVNYATNYPISQIKRIEIIRGPGSAMYGGYAEYSVINIITKDGEDLKGLQANVYTGATQNGLARLNTSFIVGDLRKDFKYSLGGMVGTGQRSDLNYTDMLGNTVNLGNGNSKLDPSFLNFSGSYKGFTLRFLSDNLITNSYDGFGDILSQAIRINHKNYFGELKKEIKIGEKLSITTRVSHKWQKPFNIAKEDELPELTYFNNLVERTRANVITSYDITKKLNINFGGEFFRDWSLSDNSNNVILGNYNNYAGFTQLLYKNKYLTPTVGLRVDKNTGFTKTALSPRIGVVSRIWKLNLKLLYNRSFRAPSVYNIAIGGTDSNGIPLLKPETSEVIEFEVGTPITRDSYFTVNLFDISTTDPILYSVTDNLNELYKNTDINGRNKLGTWGFETEYKLKKEWGFFNINYSFYSNFGKNRIQDYAAEGVNLKVDNVNLGFAQHKVNILSSVNIFNNISVSPSFSIYGNRYGYSTSDDIGTYLKVYSPIVLANLFINFKNAFNTNGLDVGFGCYDIFNQKMTFIQPNSGVNTGLPSLSREYTFRINYKLDFNKN